MPNHGALGVVSLSCVLSLSRFVLIILIFSLVDLDSIPNLFTCAPYGHHSLLFMFLILSVLYINNVIRVFLVFF